MRHLMSFDLHGVEKIKMRDMSDDRLDDGTPYSTQHLTVKTDDGQELEFRFYMSRAISERRAREQQEELDRLDAMEAHHAEQQAHHLG